MATENGDISSSLRLIQHFQKFLSHLLIYIVTLLTSFSLPWLILNFVTLLTSYSTSTSKHVRHLDLPFEILPI